MKKKVFKVLYGDNAEDFEFINFKFKKGDQVRISKLKGIFSKGYTPNWTEEIFIVDSLVPRNPPVYTLKDLNNENIEGTFYTEELQKVVQDNSFEIEKVLRTRKVKGVKQLFVKWLGYSDKFNSWILESDLQK